MIRPSKRLELNFFSPELLLRRVLGYKVLAGALQKIPSRVREEGLGGALWVLRRQKHALSECMSAFAAALQRLGSIPFKR